MSGSRGAGWCRHGGARSIYDQSGYRVLADTSSSEGVGVSEFRFAWPGRTLTGVRRVIPVLAHATVRLAALFELLKTLSRVCNIGGQSPYRLPD